MTIQMLILTYIRTILSTHHFIFTITSSHSQHSYPATHDHQIHPHLPMLTPEFIPMQRLDTHDDPHVLDEPSDSVHHIQVPHPPWFSFNGNIHPLHQQSYDIGDKVYFEETIEPYIFLGMMKKHIWQSDGSFKMEYEAELLPPIIPGYPAQPIRIQLSHKMCIHERHQFTLPHHDSLWARFLGKLESLTGIFCQRSPDFPEATLDGYTL